MNPINPNSGVVVEVPSGIVEPTTQHTAEEAEAPYVHPTSAKLFESMPCVRSIPIAGACIEAFGPSTVCSLAGVYILSKGIAKNVLGYSQYPMFMKNFGTTAAQYQRVSGIGSMGFSIKPLTAIISDAFAFLGYTKRWYMAISCVVGPICIVAYGSLPSNPSSVKIAAALIFVATFCIANVDVLSEGLYSRLIKRAPAPGTKLVSFIWLFIMLGNVIASAIQGPLSDLGKPRVGIFISGAFFIVCVVPFILNLYGEKKNLEERQEDHLQLLSPMAKQKVSEQYTPKKVLDSSAVDPNLHCLNSLPDDENVGLSVTADNSSSSISNELILPSCCCGLWEVNTMVIYRSTSVAIYGVFMTLCVLALTFLTIMGTTIQLMVGCIVISVLLTVSGFLCLPVTIMKVNLFGWAQLASYIMIPGALDNFYMGDAACVPDGPQFSQTFYQTAGAVIGNVAGMFGVYLFSTVFAKRSYRATLICTTIVLVLASIFDLIMVKRWNRPYVPDHAMYILGDAIVWQVCSMLNFMPLNILISRLCPRGCESTMFAILASFSNLGVSMSSTIGAILMETVWPVNTNVSPCDFSNVPWLIITGHFFCPLLAIPLVFMLIPSLRICEEVDPAMLDAVPYLQQYINKYRAAKSSAKQSEQPAGEEPIYNTLKPCA